MGVLTMTQAAVLVLCGTFYTCSLTAYATTEPTVEEGSTTPNGTADNEGGQTLAERRREAGARLRRHLRSLPVAQEQMIPLDTNASDAKVYLNGVFSLISIIGVDDVQQTVKTSFYARLWWLDKALTWNESSYEGTQQIIITPDMVWTPSLFVGNSLALPDVLKQTRDMYVTSQGIVVASIPLILETSCPMDLTNYPYDQQTCSIKITSTLLYHWVVYDTSFRDSLSAYLAFSVEWELTNVSTVVSDSAVIGVHPEVVMTLRRKTKFYTVCLVLPMVMTSYMNSMVFLLPLQSGEKVSFLVTISVSTSVYTSFFSNMMPRGLDSIPISIKLLIGVIVESFLVLLATIVVLRLFNSEQAAAENNKVPRETSDGCDDGSNTSSTCLSGGVSVDENEASKRQAWVKPSPCIIPRDAGMSTSHELQESPKIGFHKGKRLPSRACSVAPQGSACAPVAKRGIRQCGMPTSQQLEIVFFVLTFIGNTVFLLALYSSFLF